MLALPDLKTFPFKQGVTPKSPSAIARVDRALTRERGRTSSAGGDRTVTFGTDKTDFSTRRKRVDFEFPCCG
jgi:hypothetical protein